MNQITDLLQPSPLTNEPQEAAASEDFSSVSMLHLPVDAGALHPTSNAWSTGRLPSSQALDNLLLKIAGLDATLGSPSGPTDQYTRIPNADKMPYFDQGDSNACGSTSLAMVLNYFGINVSHEDIDKVIRRVDNSIGATPDDELQFARDHGLEAEEYNNGTWDEVKCMLDKGYPVMASVTGHNMAEIPSGNLPDGRHQIAITGYEKAADGTEYVLFHDPNDGSPGAEKKLSVSDFQTVWGDEDFGVKNFFMAFGPQGSNLPATRMDGAQGGLGALNGLANISNGFDRIFSPDNFGCFVHGIPEFFGGLVQTVGCGIGALLQLGAEKLRNLVDGIPVLQNIVEPFTDIVNGFGGSVADVFNGFGNACNSVGNAFDSLFNGDLGGFADGLGDAAGDVASGVGNAISDAAGAVGNAVSDLFSGW